eukprot:scaffold2639_cov361-Pavlova_lutheri.AAC.6
MSTELHSALLKGTERGDAFTCKRTGRSVGNGLPVCTHKRKSTYKFITVAAMWDVLLHSRCRMHCEVCNPY